MAHSHRPKQPLDVLQSMINGILIEVGRALRASDKEGGRTLANSNTRLRSFFPGAIDNFHQALDDLEGDIVRAKAVFVRDLEELQARRHALENPPIEPIEETVEHSSMVTEDLQENMMMENNEPTPQPTIKEEKTVPQDPDPESTGDKIETQDAPKDTIRKVADSSKGLQGPSPPSSLNDTNSKSNPVGLGIDTTISTDDQAPATSGPPDSSIDSLFDVPDSGNNDGSDMNFDSMEFLDSSNTQDQNDFDLSTFGNTEDFNIDLQASNDASNTNDTGNKHDDIFGMGNTGGGDDMMDLDLDLGGAGGDTSMFDDMFLDLDNNRDGGGEMEHGDIDNNFFGL